MCQAALILHPALLLSLPPSFRRDLNQTISARCSLLLRGCLLLESCTRTTTLFHGYLGPKVARLTFLTSPQPSLLHLTTCEIDHRSGLHPVFFFCCQDRANFTLVEALRDYNCITSVDFELSASHSFGCKSIFSPR